MRVCRYTINVHGFHLNPQAAEVQERLSGINMEPTGLKIYMIFSLNAGTVLVDGCDENNNNETLYFYSAINFKMYLYMLSLI